MDKSIFSMKKVIENFFDASVILKKTAHSKQSPNGQKFAQKFRPIWSPR
jgi:hypothetical protein